MISVKNERKHILVSGKDIPNTPDELAYLIVHYVIEYLWTTNTKDDYAGVLGAIELAKHEIMKGRL